MTTVYETAVDAIAGTIRDGSVIAVGGFGLSGIPRLRSEPGSVGDVEVDGVDGGLAVRAGGDEHGRPRVQRDCAVVTVAEPARRAAE